MTYSVQDICDRYGVGEHTVLGWIRRGELKAINVGRNPSGKKKWRVTEEALAAFEQLRTPTPPATPTRRRKRPVDVIQRY